MKGPKENGQANDGKLETVEGQEEQVAGENGAKQGREEERATSGTTHTKQREGGGADLVEQTLVGHPAQTTGLVNIEKKQGVIYAEKDCDQHKRNRLGPAISNRQAPKERENKSELLRKWQNRLVDNADEFNIWHPN